MLKPINLNFGDPTSTDSTTLYYWTGEYPISDRDECELTIFNNDFSKCFVHQIELSRFASEFNSLNSTVVKNPRQLCGKIESLLDGAQVESKALVGFCKEKDNSLERIEVTISINEQIEWKWHIELEESNDCNALVYKHYISPSINVQCKMVQVIEDLFEWLELKDKEIAEWKQKFPDKFKGPKSTRKFVRTEQMRRWERKATHKHDDGFSSILTQDLFQSLCRAANNNNNDYSSLTESQSQFHSQSQSQSQSQQVSTHTTTESQHSTQSFPSNASPETNTSIIHTSSTAGSSMEAPLTVYKSAPVKQKKRKMI